MDDYLIKTTKNLYITFFEIKKLVYSSTIKTMINLYLDTIKETLVWFRTHNETDQDYKYKINLCKLNIEVYERYLKELLRNI